MPTLIITRGLPGSGKTTMAREWVGADPAGRARVNRDDLRAMCHDSRFTHRMPDGAGTERAITAFRDESISALLKRGVDVICDDTNLPSRTVRQLRRLALLAGAGWEVWDLTNIPLQVCLDRNVGRTGRDRVPNQVILDLHRRYIAGAGYPLPIADEPADEPQQLEPYVPVPGTPAAVLVDVDGTVALKGTRDPYDQSRVCEDRPNLPVIATVQAMCQVGFEIVFCSARTETCRSATEKWLDEHVEVPFELFMRPEGDMRKDAVVKAELFDRHIRDRFAVMAVFDDRRQVVDMWRSMGLTVFQVAEGNF